jgi:hypothetical protein
MVFSNVQCKCYFTPCSIYHRSIFNITNFGNTDLPNQSVFSFISKLLLSKHQHRQWANTHSHNVYTRKTLVNATPHRQQNRTVDILTKLFKKLYSIESYTMSFVVNNLDLTIVYLRRYI